MEGEPGLTLTGQLGDVMKESAQIALSYIRSHAKDSGIDRPLHEGRYPRSRSGGRRTQGWTLCGRRHGYGADESADGQSRSQRRRHDR